MNEVPEAPTPAYHLRSLPLPPCKRKPCIQVPWAGVWGLVIFRNILGDLDTIKPLERRSCPRIAHDALRLVDFNSCFLVDLYPLEGQGPVWVDLKNNVLFEKSQLSLLRTKTHRLTRDSKAESQSQLVNGKSGFSSKVLKEERSGLVSAVPFT